MEVTTFANPYFLFPDQSPPSLQLQCSPVHRLIIVIKVFPTLGELARLGIKRDQIRKAVKRDFCRSQTLTITITMPILRVKGSFPFTKEVGPRLFHLLHFPPLFSTKTLQWSSLHLRKRPSNPFSIMKRLHKTYFWTES